MTIDEAHDALESMKDVRRNYKTGPEVWGPLLKGILNKDTISTLDMDGMKLKGKDVAFWSARKKNIASLSHALDTRFSGVARQDEIIEAAVAILNFKAWLEKQELIRDYGINDIAILSDHFGSFLGNKLLEEFSLSLKQNLLGKSPEHLQKGSTHGRICFPSMEVIFLNSLNVLKPCLLPIIQCCMRERLQSHEKEEN